MLLARNIRVKNKSRKLLPKFIGPFQVASQKCKNTYLIEDLPFMRKRRVWRRFNAHVAQLKPFQVREDVYWCPGGQSEPREIEGPTEDSDGDPMETEETEGADVVEEASTLEANNFPSKHSIPEESTELMTRLGRRVRSPIYLNDYYMENDA